jgi:hypothetical protein
MSGGVCAPRHTNGRTEHRVAVYDIFVLKTVPPKHMDNFSRPLEMIQCQEHKPFAGTICFLNAEPLLKTSSAADGHQQHGQVTLR